MKYLTNSIILLVTIIIVTGCTGQKKHKICFNAGYTDLYATLS